MWKAAILCLVFTIAVTPVAGCAQVAETYAGEPAQYVPYTEQQLDNLLAPIALYPDPLLAQVLVAATFPDQIDVAARWVRSFGDKGVDEQPWDVSVRSIAHYPTVLYMMDDDLDWTTALGQAYAYQSTDVMASVQRLRAMARAQGNLVTTPQQQVVVEGGYIAIWPASPQYIYVPAYDPAIVFFQPVYVGGSYTALSFGAALGIGVWLNLDCDWHRHRVYYTGWHGGGWIARSRSHVHINARYVAPHFATILVNRRVIRRPVNYVDLSRYHGIHRNTNFNNRIHPRERPGVRRPARVPNKIIDRNIPPNQRLDRFRGRQAVPPRLPSQVRPSVRRPAPAHRPPQPKRVAPRAPSQPGPAVPVRRPPNAFGRGDGLFDPNAAARRGRDSREAVHRPPAPSRQAPRNRQRQPERRHDK